MKFIIMCILSLLIAGCSTQAIDMAAEATVQLNDLADDEGDGVINARDLCNDTDRGAKINNSGCGSEALHIARRELLINFANNSYVVEPEYFGKIEELATFMNAYPRANVTIEGHTSKVGSKALNDLLSQNRAMAIKDILVNRFGIDEKRVTALGFGFERLLLEGNTDVVHARNRRIVAEISSDKTLTDWKWTIYSVDERAEDE